MYISAASEQLSSAIVSGERMLPRIASKDVPFELIMLGDASKLFQDPITDVHALLLADHRKQPQTTEMADHRQLADHRKREKVAFDALPKNTIDPPCALTDPLGLDALTAKRH